jgi:hypothetical protein
LLKHSNAINGDNLNYQSLEANRHFRNEKGKHLKDKVNEIAKHNKKKNIRDLYRGK